MAGIKRRDPRQKKFQALYADPRSPTFGNAYRSAMAAGYKHRYAKLITAPSTDSSVAVEAVRMYEEKVKKANRNLDRLLDLPEQEQVFGMFGPLKDKETGEPIMRMNTKAIAIKADVTKFTLERLDKKRYSLKDPTGGEGSDRPTPILQQFNVYINNSDQENRGPEEARPSDTGGQFGE